MELLDIGIAILMATVFLVIASTSSVRVSVGLLILLAPFHAVTVLTITNSIAMAYMVVLGILLSGKSLKIPMFGAMLFVLLGYLISISQQDPSVYKLHGIWLITLISGFAMFVLGFNLAKVESSPRAIVNLLLTANVIIDIYCLVQLIVGPGNSAAFFGFEAMSFEANRGEGDPRLGGPFGGAPGIVSEYLALLSIVVIYDALHSERQRRTRLWLLVAVNIGLLVATGNRGGFLTFGAGLVGFLYLFRKDFGTFRAMQIAMIATGVLVVASLVVIQLTDFNVMFDRLGGVTDTENGIPATRQVSWPRAWQRVTEVPWFGQGPTWKLPMEEHGAVYPGHVFFDYPHSLYLYLLVTVGAVGTFCFAIFFAVLGIKYLQAARVAREEPNYLNGLIRLGPLLLVMFLVDQIRIEFLRPVFSDYQHVIFSLFGIWLGLGHRAPSVNDRAQLT